jgi:hypothetical protein
LPGFSVPQFVVEKARTIVAADFGASEARAPLAMGTDSGARCGGRAADAGGAAGEERGLAAQAHIEWLVCHETSRVVLAGGSEVTRRLSCWFDYLGGNCELGTGSARFSVGALSMNPITAQLMSVPVAP